MISRNRIQSKYQTNETMIEAYGSSRVSPSQKKIYQSVFKQDRLQKMAKEQVTQD